MSWLNDTSALWDTVDRANMTSTCKFVTKDMIPKEWRFTEEQDREWLTHVAKLMPGESAHTLMRIVAVELPDTHGA